MDRKKELKEQYKQMKTEMGIFVVKNKSKNKYLLVTTHNLKGMMNRVRFQLKSGGHPNMELQKDWKESGAENIKIEILEILEYDKDESKTDYTEELNIMEIMWQDKMSQNNMESYKVRI
ncbi:MAG: GIY-YIG nuclease family protein [Tissierellia bacterium]|nr:GIY-YIG nuclease family protein [Tissierellia bacterium]MDD3226098.1 GIY-YIG nuclease family protein [Tissierellia bacterium]MDD3750635.1 GIY-YIG nuclease family protein [Tissierellia bacterium]